MSAGDSTTVSISDKMMHRASALADHLGDAKPGLLATCPGSRITKTAALRFAAHRGLEVLREECGGFEWPGVDTVAGVGEEGS